MLTLLVVPIAGPLSDTLALFFIQVILILIIVRVLGYALYRLRQPIVIGEIIAGILLGPSALGQISGFTANVFPPDSVNTLSLIANLGLTFFMFFLGLEVDPVAIRVALRSSVPIAVASILVPFGCGAALSEWFYALTVTSASFTTFLLFLGVSTSFTAFPVLARVLTTSKLLDSPLGVKAISCAAVDDLLGWCALALTLSYAAGGGIVVGVYVALIAFGFILFQVYVIRPCLVAIQNYCIEVGDPVNRNYVALLFMLLLLSGWFCDILQIHAFFGAFIFGICVPKNPQLIEDLAPKIELLIVEFFLPIYFANSGLKTDLTSLDSGVIWAALFAMIAVGTAAKLLPVMFIARLTSEGGLMKGLSWKLCLTLGILMNTRGLVALIALNVGLSAGILDTRIFSVLVVFSLVTTFITPPALYFLYERDYHAEKARLAALGSEHPSHVTEGTPNASLEPLALEEQQHAYVAPSDQLASISGSARSYSADKQIAVAPASIIDDNWSPQHSPALLRQNSTTDLSQPIGARDFMLSTAGNSISTRNIFKRMQSTHDALEAAQNDTRHRLEPTEQPNLARRHTLTSETNEHSVHPSFAAQTPFVGNPPALHRAGTVGIPSHERYASQGTVRTTRVSHANPLTITMIPEPDKEAEENILKTY